MKRPGFTLIEMVVVLGIISLLGLLIVPRVSNRYVQWEHQRFWKELRQEWQFAQVSAVERHQITEIYYDPQRRELVFLAQNNRHLLKVPRKLYVEKIKSTVMKSNGYIRPDTWYFVDQLNHQKIQMKIQLAGGGYRIEKQRFYS